MFVWTIRNLLPIRHALDYLYLFQVNDRVRVTLGVLYWDTTGYVLEVNNDILTIGVPEGTFKAPIYNVTCEFYLGDLVEVKRNARKGEFFVIVKFNPTGRVILYQAAYHAISQVYDPKYELEIPIADIWFDHKHMYDRKRIFEPEEPLPQTVPNYDNLEARLQKAKPGRRYKGISVQIKKGPHKGLRGVVVGDHDSVLRVEHMKSQPGARWDQSGILLTIGEEKSNHRVENIPIENVMHEFTKLPLDQARFLPDNVLFGLSPLREEDRPLFRGPFPISASDEPPRPRTSTLPPSAPLWTSEQLEPTLAGEDSGQWISLPQILNKRLDVKIVGVAHLRKASAAMKALEVPSRDLKVKVYGAGKNSNMHSVDRACIKPRREGDAGQSFWDMTERIVILGPDVHSNTTRIGLYAQTKPSCSHPHGRGIITIKFPGNDEEMAKNILILAMHGNFEATVFK
ncbi:hypothetical protein K438DRAFT_1998437 [Mycena galopus ATCC 62051]|nr:hypothetical protein K438DRAFT_1998437 [Mycena galopus ATCC 62051]